MSIKKNFPVIPKCTNIKISLLKKNIKYLDLLEIFLIFDVEVIFLFPWAVVFKDLGLLALVEMGIFLLILSVGLAYVWVKSDLDWVKRRVRYGTGRYKNIAIGLPKINFVKSGFFDYWLKSKKKLGGQHKIPRLSNQRNYIEEMNKNITKFL